MVIPEIWNGFFRKPFPKRPNSGESWEVLGDLPCTYVHDLAVHPRENVIIIATHGRGMFILDADPVNTKKEE